MSNSIQTLYFNTTENEMRVYTGTAWVAVGRLVHRDDELDRQRHQQSGGSRYVRLARGTQSVGQTEPSDESRVRSGGDCIFA